MFVSIVLSAFLPNILHCNISVKNVMYINNLETPEGNMKNLFFAKYFLDKRYVSRC